MSEESSLHLGTDDAWRELEDFVGHVGRMARSSADESEFFYDLLSKLVSTLAAVGGAVWRVDASGEEPELAQTCQINLDALADEWDLARDQGHRQLLLAIARGVHARYVPSKSDAHDAPLTNPSEYGLYLAPIVVEGEVGGVIELVQRSGGSPAAQRGHLKLLTTVAELAGDYLRRAELLRLRAQRASFAQFEQYVHIIHMDADLATVATHVVNEAARFVDCDRVSLVLPVRGRIQLIAVSGVADFDRRSNAMRSLEQLARVYHRLGDRDGYWYPLDGAALSSDLRQAVDAYVALSGVKQLAVLTLASAIDGEPAGVFIAESFRLGEIDRERADTAARHAGLAVEQAQRFTKLPFGRLLQRLSSTSMLARARQLGRPMIAMTALACLVICLCLVKAEFRIRVDGELRPETRREIFAPFDADVAQLATDHDDVVQAGDLLLKLSSSELDLEFQRVRGDYETASQRLRAVRSARVRIEPSEENATSRLSQLSAEEEELKTLLHSKEQELSRLREDRQRLELHSPIDGRVLTWDTARLLEHRPVRRGQSLLTVADTAGAWVVDLKIPHDDIGYLLAARDATDGQLPISFALSEQVFHGNVDPVDGLVSWDADRATRIVEVTAAFNDTEFTDRRPGAIASVYIHCGRRAIGYVWLHDVIETMRRHWLLFRSPTQGNGP